MPEIVNSGQKKLNSNVFLLHVTRTFTTNRTTKDISMCVRLAKEVPPKMQIYVIKMQTRRAMNLLICDKEYNKIDNRVNKS